MIAEHPHKRSCVPANGERLAARGARPWVLWLLASLILLNWPVSDGDCEALVTEPRIETAGGSPIHISSDAVTLNQEERWVEFAGNVRATQDDVVVTADRMRIFYRADRDAQEGAAAIERIVCQGNVIMVFDQNTKTATAEQAVYLADQEVLELTGGEPTVRSGKNVIQGEKITLFQAENRSLVESGDKGQVEATFYSDDKKGLMK